MIHFKKLTFIFALTIILSSCKDGGEFHQSIPVSKDVISTSPEISDTPSDSSGPSDSGSEVMTCMNGSSEWIKENCFLERFTQTDVKKKVDILWVIDDSGSMKDEQMALGQNFSAFIKGFVSTQVDFKMAITTTDIFKNGLMVPGSDVKLTSAKAKESPETFINDFQTLVNVGINGSGIERGLSATEGFMQRYGATFNRPDAYTVVVILSDEEDQSLELPSYYVEKLKAQKMNMGLVKIYSIIPTLSANPFNRYIEASKSTGGTLGNISGDFYPVLAEIGSSIINLLDSFPLAQSAMSSTIAVKVNGVETKGFIYDEPSHAIKFNPDQIPPKGAEIVVTYQKKAPMLASAKSY